MQKNVSDGWYVHRSEMPHDVIYMCLRKGDRLEKKINDITIFILKNKFRTVESVNTPNYDLFSRIVANAKSRDLIFTPTRKWKHQVNFKQVYSSKIEILWNVNEVLRFLEEVDQDVNELRRQFTISFLTH